LPENATHHTLQAGEALGGNYTRAKHILAQIWENEDSSLVY